MKNSRCDRLVLALFPALLLAGAAFAEHRDLRGIEGVQELVILSSDPAAAARVWGAPLGYRPIAAGRPDSRLAGFWGLASARLLGHEQVLAAPGATTGFLRLIELRGALGQVRIRSSARPFDSGGIFNFNVLVHDIDAVFADLRAAGAQGYADPNRYAIFGKRYAGALLVGPDGAAINLLQRVGQSYDDLAPFKVASHIINATQVVRDFALSQRFFREQLGWTQRWEASPAWPADGSNNMGLPQSLVQSGDVRERAASFAVGADARGGTIEILAFEGLRGTDYAARARAPNAGLLAYRVHVRNLTILRQHLLAKAVAIEAEARNIVLAPYGRVDLLRVVAPDGAWIEFFSQLESS